LYSHSRQPNIGKSQRQVGKVIGQKKAHVKEIQVNGGSTADKANWTMIGDDQETSQFTDL
jgi:hypothetical protein